MKALRAHQLYLPNNPIYQRATTRFASASQPIWACSTSSCSRSPRARSGGRSRWSTTAQQGDSLAWGLFKDGVRELTHARAASRPEELTSSSRPSTARGVCPPDAGRPAHAALGGGVRVPPVPLHRLLRRDAACRSRPGSYAAARCRRRPRPAVAARRQPRRRRRGPRASIGISDFDSTLYFLDERRDRVAGDRQSKRVPPGRPATALNVLFDLFETPGRRPRSARRSSAYSRRCSPISSTRAISGRRPRCFRSAACSTKRAQAWRRRSGAPRRVRRPS